MPAHEDRQKVKEDVVKTFRSKVLVACPNLVTLKEQRIISNLPLKIFEDVYSKVFNADMKLATKVLFNQYKDSSDGLLPIPLLSAPNEGGHLYNYDFSDHLGEGEEELKSIYTIKKAADFFSEAVLDNLPTLVISDVDSDGSIAQSIAVDVRKLTGQRISISSRDYNSQEMGFNLEQIQQYVEDSELRDDDPFLVICADMGSNQKHNQEQFLKRYPKGKLIIADHHTLQAENRVEENLPRSVLVSPFVKGSARLSLKRGGGVSGSYLLYSIVSMSLRSIKSNADFALQRNNGLAKFIELGNEEFVNRLRPLREMAKVANLLEYTDTDIRMKPLNEFEIERAYKVSALTNKGKSLGKWITESQKKNIDSIRGIIGDESAEVFQSLRVRMLEQNHIARSIFESLGIIFAKQKTGELSNKEVPELIASNIVDINADTSADRNYLELLRPYVFNFEYENQFPEDVKGIWLKIATTCLNSVGKIESEIIEEIRAHKLIVEVPRGGKDFITITRPENPLISTVFTERQRSMAYSSASKEVDMSVTYLSKDKVVIKARSEHSLRDILSHEGVSDPEVKDLLSNITFSGHANIGYIEFPVLRNVNPIDYIERLADVVDLKIKSILDKRVLENVIEVAPIHLDIMKEIFQKMRLHLEPSVSPNLVMRISENSHFEDAYTAQMRSIKDIAEEDPWMSTSESLNFEQTSRLSIPNQAIKAVLNANFTSALGVKYLPNGNYMVNKVITATQLENSKNKLVLEIPLDKERKALKKYYIDKYVATGKHITEIPRDEAMSSLKFMRDGSDVFKKNESLMLGAMDRLGADSYIVIDVEADGGANAVCIMVGLAIFTKIDGSGEKLSKDDLMHRLAHDGKNISNYREIGEGEFIANEQLKVELTSHAINKDGTKPIRVSMKTQNLTNLTQEFLDEVGMSSIDAQDQLVEILSNKGKFILQAHNLPYDRNIARVNFPKFYDVMKTGIQLDSAIPSKELELAYVSTTVSVIDRKNFYNASHVGYNLSTLLEDRKKHPAFQYPGLKGDVILDVSGEEINMIDLKTGVSSRVNMDRESLSLHARKNVTSVSSPQYGIAKMLRMLTIKEMISHKPFDDVTKIDFISYGVAALPSKLWEHFQNNYAFEFTLEQNLDNFQVLPDSREFMQSELHVENVDRVDEKFAEYRNYGAGKTYELGVKPTKRAVELFTTISGRDLLKANAIRFLNTNSEQAERYSLAWAYESVLDNHEVTSNPKDMGAGFFDGMSKMTGFPDSLLRKIYDDAYDYKQSRNIRTYKIHETHNVVSPEGDAYQEVHAFLYLLHDKTRNPFANGEFSLDLSINPNYRAINAITQEAAASTIKQTIKDISGVVIDSSSVNSFSSKQVDNFSDDGISIKGQRTGIPSFTCKGILGVDVSTGVKIEVPDFDVDAYRLLSKAERMSVENRLNEAVSAIIFANSLNDKSLTTLGSGMLLRALTSPAVTSALEDVSLLFGNINVSRREYYLKSMCSSISQAIIGKEELKLPGNPEVPPNELDEMVIMFSQCIDKLKNEQGFNSFVSVDDLKHAVEIKKSEFYVYQETIKTGVLVKEVSGFEKPSNFGLPSAALKSITNSLKEHSDINPQLTEGIMNVKKDPLAVFLQTPMVSAMVKISDKNQIKHNNNIATVQRRLGR